MGMEKWHIKTQTVVPKCHMYAKQITSGGYKYISIVFQCLWSQNILKEIVTYLVGDFGIGNLVWKIDKY